MINPIQAARALLGDLKGLQFGLPVVWVYNPLEYAWAAYADYIEKYGLTAREVVLLGMNPGPWGMVQTGVPFGEVDSVHDWLQVRDHDGRPAREHAKRPVQGHRCPRSEVSGRRLWGWAKEKFGSPERFFERFIVLNYCPLVFMEESARNRTPDKLPAGEQALLFEACDRHLSRVLEFYRPRFALGIGKFAGERIRSVQNTLSFKVQTGSILHPSPASPAANRGWADQAEKQLKALGIELGP